MLSINNCRYVSYKIINNINRFLLKYYKKNGKISKQAKLREELIITIIYKILNKFFDLLDEYKPKRKYIITLGAILLAFLIGIVILTVNIKYVFYARNIEDKASGYRLGNWYYNSLTYKEQLLYDEIDEAAKKIKAETDNLPYVYTEEEFNIVLKSYMNDNPQIFYLTDYETQLFTSSKKSYVKLNYYNNKAEIKKMKTELNNKLHEITLMLYEKYEYTDDFDIETMIHDYIVLNCKGTTDTDYIYNTAYGALINQKAYSGGYSAAFKLLMNRFGLVCYIIEGEVNNQQHLWNIVFINDSFYHVDVTWNDSDLSYSEDLLFHAYFNLSNNIIMGDHDISEFSILPAANTETNYYNVKNLYINDIEDLKLRINRVILNAIEQDRLFIELYTNFGADIYEGKEFHDIIINSIQQINLSDSKISLDESFRIYKAAENKNILTIQLYNLEK